MLSFNNFQFFITSYDRSFGAVVSYYFDIDFHIDISVCREGVGNKSFSSLFVILGT